MVLLVISTIYLLMNGIVISQTDIFFCCCAVFFFRRLRMQYLFGNDFIKDDKIVKRLRNSLLLCSTTAGRSSAWSPFCQSVALGDRRTWRATCENPHASVLHHTSAVNDAAVNDACCIRKCENKTYDSIEFYNLARVHTVTRCFNMTLRSMCAQRTSTCFCAV